MCCGPMSSEKLSGHVRERAIPEELTSIASPFKGPREPDPAGLQLYSDEIGTVPAWMTWASQWLPFRWP